MSITIISWNVNSVRARLPLVVKWLSDNQPDVVLLQELKCTNHDFPKEQLEDLGYNTACWGEKSYNGVAILSKNVIEDVQQGIPQFEDHVIGQQARYIQGFTAGITVSSVYVPNGQEPGAPAYYHKLDFYSALAAHIKNTLTQDCDLILGGDFNVAPEDSDVHDPIKWQEKILCSTLEREAFSKLLKVGLVDLGAALKVHDFTWWDYRQGSFARNHGLRIDHFLVSSTLLNKCRLYQVDRTCRQLPRPSDHAPIILTIDN